MIKQTVIVDIPVDIPKELRDLSKAFAYVLLNIGSLYELQRKKDLSLDVENGIWREISKQLRTAEISEDQKHIYEEQLQTLEKGIYDLYPITVKFMESEMDLIIGKVFGSEGDRVSYYSGVAGVVNNQYEHVIDEFDSRLDDLYKELMTLSLSGTTSIRDKAPELKCIDVFSLAGGLDVSHKPICIFFSGDNPQNISSLSNMTVFLNLYTSRFRALTIEVSKRYLQEAKFLEDMDNSEISKLLLIWLRGHDVGHFIGEDKLGEEMSEFDPDYMILHELKSDMIALYSFRMFASELLGGGLLEKIYYLSIAEMLRYIRRGNILNHPDSASAYLAWRYFEHHGAIKLDARYNKYVVDLRLLEVAISDFTNELLNIFKEGNVESARNLVNRFGSIENSNENDPSPKDCSEDLRQVINDTDIAHFIDYSFIISE